MRDRHDPCRRASLADTVEAATRAVPLPCGGRVTWEPGGQLEVSSHPYEGATDACRAAAADTLALGVALGSRGFDLVGVGHDPLRTPERLLQAPRYEAMEGFFRSMGGDPLHAMCSTAAIQVNLEPGADPGDVERRWRRAHLLGPVLMAAFANSPLSGGRPTGLRSTRAARWRQLDPSRTAPAFRGGTAADDWYRYVIDALVMLIRRDDQHHIALDRRLPFGRWLESGHELGWPTEDDLAYHLSTLFPPVRPKGWLELRFLDALPHLWWPVAVTLSALLMDDTEAAERAERAAAPAAGLWDEAARSGLSHPVLGDAASACFAVALDHDPSPLTAAYHDRYVARGRVPADDLLEEYAWT